MGVGEWELMLQLRLDFARWQRGTSNTDRRRSRLDMVEMEGIADNQEKIQKQYSEYF